MHSGEEPAAPPPCLAKGQGALVHLPSRLGHRIHFRSCCCWYLVIGLVRQLVGFSLQKGIVVEAVSDSELSFWVGRCIHSTCARCCLLIFSTIACRGAGYLNTLSFSLNELESNSYPGGKMDHCKDNAEIKHVALECYQIPPNNHNPFQPVFLKCPSTGCRFLNGFILIFLKTFTIELLKCQK